MKKHILFPLILFVLFLLPFHSFGADATPQAANPGKTKAGGDGKKQAYTGDPAIKRGFELGYDDGVKAGKEDKKNGKKENVTVHEDYKKGDKKFRSEYGNRGKFVAGYQGGFLKGYKSGYNRGKIDLEAAKQTKIKEKEKPAEKEAGNVKTPKDPLKPNISQNPLKPKPRHPPTPSDDAL